MAKTNETEEGEVRPPPRKDGRRAALFYMKPAVVEAVKEIARAGDMKAWQLVERAVLKEPGVSEAAKRILKRMEAEAKKAKKTG